MKATYTLCSDPESAQRTVDALRKASSELGFDAKRIVVVTPEPFDGYEFADEHKKSPLFVLAAIGGAVGALLGYLLTSTTQRAYPLPTGGMPIVPPWTDGIIVYELTMLGAIVTTIVSLLVGARLPNFSTPLSDPEIGAGKILVGVKDPPENSRAELAKHFREAGALELKEFSSTAAR